MLGKRKKPKVRDSSEILVVPNLEMLEDLGFVEETPSRWVYQLYSSESTKKYILISKMSVYIVDNELPNLKTDMVSLWEYLFAGEISSQNLKLYINLLEAGTMPPVVTKEDNSPW